MSNPLIISIARIQAACHALSYRLKHGGFAPVSQRPIRIAGIPRGGISVAYALAAFEPTLYEVTEIEHADILVDDLADSGATRQRYAAKYNKKVAVLFTKREAADIKENWIYAGTVAPDQWLVFPWEGNADFSADDIPLRLLQFIGEDPQREGLKETPARFLKAWQAHTAGYSVKPEDVLKNFEDGGTKYDEMVIVKNIPVYSHCEHHLEPFFGVAHVAYIPNGRIVGLSKLVRLVDIYAKRLQVQERMTQQIGEALFLNDELNPKGVGVVIECRHMCMESRGVCAVGTTTVTSNMRGAMLTKPEARAELLSLVRGKHG